MRIEIEIPDNRVADLLSTAWEGGSNYWAKADGQPYNIKGELTLKPGEKIPVYDMENEGACFNLTLDKVQRGLTLMATKAPKQLGRFLADDEDAVTGDCLLQLALFEDIVYG